MDEEAREVRRGGDLIELTATEFELLRFLMRNPRRVLSKAQILDRVWNYDFGGQAHVVELYISYLRKKIDSGREPMIHTVRGRRLRAQAGRRRPGADAAMNDAAAPARRAGLRRWLAGRTLRGRLIAGPGRAARRGLRRRRPGHVPRAARVSLPAAWTSSSAAAKHALRGVRAGAGRAAARRLLHD